jgi:MFS family permease
MMICGGVLFYAFPVLAPAIDAHTGWSASALTAAFSLSQIVAAVVSVPVGRLARDLDDKVMFVGMSLP